MKKIIFVLLSLMFFSCNDKSNVIRGTLNADKNGAIVYLKEYKRRNTDAPIDSTVIINNKFSIGSNKLNGIYSLEIPEIEPLLIILDGKKLDVYIDLNDGENNTCINSEINEQFKVYNATIKSFEKQAKEIKTEYNKALEDGDDILLDELNMQITENNSQLESFIGNFIKENPKSIITAYTVYNRKAYFLEKELTEIYAGFSTDTKKSLYGKNIMETLGGLKRTAIGNLFVDLKMKTPEGRDIALSDYVGKGKYVLINFWASWCPYCRKENPDLVEIYNNYKDRGFEIIGVSLDRTAENWEEAIKADSLQWVQMSDLKYWESVAMPAYAIVSIPFSVLVDKEGKIIAKGISSEELRVKLEEVL